MKWYQTFPAMISDKARKLQAQGYNLREVIEGKYPNIKVAKVGIEGKDKVQNDGQGTGSKAQETKLD